MTVKYVYNFILSFTFQNIPIDLEILTASKYFAIFCKQNFDTEIWIKALYD